MVYSFFLLAGTTVAKQGANSLEKVDLGPLRIGAAQQQRVIGDN